MNIQETKKQLMQQVALLENEGILKRLQSVLDEDLEALKEEDFRELDLRRRRHLNGESKSFSWEEVKANLLNDF